MELFNVECLTPIQLKRICLFSIPHEKKEEFVYLTENIDKKYEILLTAKNFIDIVLRDSVECCLYCEEKMEKMGLFCDSLCESLYEGDDERGNISG